MQSIVRTGQSGQVAAEVQQVLKSTGMQGADLDEAQQLLQKLASLPGGIALLQVLQRPDGMAQFCERQRNELAPLQRNISIQQCQLNVREDQEGIDNAVDDLISGNKTLTAQKATADELWVQFIDCEAAIDRNKSKQCRAEEEALRKRKEEACEAAKNKSTYTWSLGASFCGEFTCSFADDSGSCPAFDALSSEVQSIGTNISAAQKEWEKWAQLCTNLTEELLKKEAECKAIDDEIAEEEAKCQEIKSQFQATVCMFGVRLQGYCMDVKAWELAVEHAKEYFEFHTTIAWPAFVKQYCEMISCNSTTGLPNQDQVQQCKNNVTETGFDQLCGVVDFDSGKALAEAWSCSDQVTYEFGSGQKVTSLVWSKQDGFPNCSNDDPTSTTTTLPTTSAAPPTTPPATSTSIPPTAPPE